MASERECKVSRIPATPFENTGLTYVQIYKPNVYPRLRMCKSLDPSNLLVIPELQFSLYQISTKSVQPF